MTSKLKIAIAKGNLFQEGVKHLETVGISLGDYDKRKLILPTSSQDWEILLVRGHDVPAYVEHGAADLGIVGSDVVIDSQAEVMQLKDLEFAPCKLCVCAPKDKYKSLADLPAHTRVATTFPNISQDYFHQHGISVEVIHLYGSVELGPLTELSDVIVDLVATGKTLKENGLEVIDTIMDCSARLIANKASYRLNKKLIEAISN